MINLIEKIAFGLIILFILVNAYLHQDSPIAVVSAICGITYTVFAGKGKPFCYLFGVTGSFFYSYLSFANALWGNLILYAGYYIPMQVLGFFQWNKNLKQEKNEIIKTTLALKEMLTLLFVTFILSLLVFCVLKYFNDSHPVYDSVTTVFSVAGMYLTVKRAIEQWIFWMIVNFLSFIMWLNVLISGERVYSTVIMWAVYLFLAFYFYIRWKKELTSNK